MERTCANALALARFSRPIRRSLRVHYPGLETHAEHERAGEAFSCFGGLFAFN